MARASSQNVRDFARIGIEPPSVANGIHSTSRNRNIAKAQEILENQEFATPAWLRVLQGV
jgi:hypothetical protein